jgi:hypothetical protein
MEQPSAAARAATIEIGHDVKAITPRIRGSAAVCFRMLQLARRGHVCYGG